MTHRGPCQPLLFWDSGILWFCKCRPPYSRWAPPPSLVPRAAGCGRWGSVSCHPAVCTEGQSRWAWTIGIYGVSGGRLSSWGKGGISGAGHRRQSGFFGQKFPMSGKKSTENLTQSSYTLPVRKLRTASWVVNTKLSSQHHRKLTGMSGVLDRFIWTDTCRHEGVGSLNEEKTTATHQFASGIFYLVPLFIYSQSENVTPTQRTRQCQELGVFEKCNG